MKSEWNRRTMTRSTAAAASGYYFINVVSLVHTASGQELQFISALKGKRESQQELFFLGDHVLHLNWAPPPSLPPQQHCPDHGSGGGLSPGHLPMAKIGPSPAQQLLHRAQALPGSGTCDGPKKVPCQWRFFVVLAVCCPFSNVCFYRRTLMSFNMTLFRPLSLL